MTSDTRLPLRMLYRYFRSGGIYRYEPKPRWKAARLAWVYWRKRSRAQVG